MIKKLFKEDGPSASRGGRGSFHPGAEVLPDGLLHSPKGFHPVLFLLPSPAPSPSQARGPGSTGSFQAGSTRLKKPRTAGTPRHPGPGGHPEWVAGQMESPAHPPLARSAGHWLATIMWLPSGRDSGGCLMWGWIALGLVFLRFWPQTKAERDVEERREEWRNRFDQDMKDFQTRCREKAFLEGAQEEAAREREWERMDAIQKRRQLLNPSDTPPSP